jgi:hypothetical protein
LKWFRSDASAKNEVRNSKQRQKTAIPMSEQLNNKFSGPDGPHFSIEADTPQLPAWTEVEKGRFMPRRVRGSCQGRALG